MNKILGILGGMGPLATADLFRKIVLLTEAACDQEHIHIVVDSNPAIPDRTAYLVNNGQSPLSLLVESAKKLESMNVSCIIMPCNTAHFFYPDIIREINTPFLNMIEETAKEIIKEHPSVKTVGLLATEGTCRSGIYKKCFDNHNINIVKPDNKYQTYISNFIYGIKKGDDQSNISGVLETIDELSGRGAELFILGCTELPVGFQMHNIKEETVDPTEVLAKSAISFLNKKINR